MSLHTPWPPSDEPHFLKSPTRAPGPASCTTPRHKWQSPQRAAFRKPTSIKSKDCFHPASNGVEKNKALKVEIMGWLARVAQFYVIFRCPETWVLHDCVQMALRHFGILCWKWRWCSQHVSKWPYHRKLLFQYGLEAGSSSVWYWGHFSTENDAKAR